MTNRFDNLIDNTKDNSRDNSRFGSSDSGSSRFGSDSSGSSRFGSSDSGSSRFGSSRFGSDSDSRLGSDSIPGSGLGSDSRFDSRFGSRFDSKPKNNFLNKKRENKITNEGKIREEQNSLFSLINKKIKIETNKYTAVNNKYNANKYTPSKKHNSFKADIKPVKEKKVEMKFDEGDFPAL